MKTFLISIHPKFIDSYKEFGVFKSAIEKNLATIECINLRNFAVDKHGSIDSRPYGGGDGMVMRPEPLAAAVSSIKEENPYVIMTSPRGKTWKEADAHRLLKLNRPLVFVCGRFAGVDERFITQYVDEEISVGDFIVSGGELPALLILDSILRHIPGALGHEESAQIDSFGERLEGQLEFPLYTKPLEFEGLAVPEVLLSGHHQVIEDWRKKQSGLTTQKFRPDLNKS